MMSHIPFGYTIQNGMAVINEEEAVKFEKLFETYFSRLSLSGAAQKAGINATIHFLQVLADKRYVRDKFIRQLSPGHIQRASLNPPSHFNRSAVFVNIEEMEEIINFKFHVQCQIIYTMIDFSRQSMLIVLLRAR